MTAPDRFAPPSAASQEPERGEDVAVDALRDIVELIEAAARDVTRTRTTRMTKAAEDAHAVAVIALGKELYPDD